MYGMAVKNAAAKIHAMKKGGGREAASQRRAMSKSKRVKIKRG